MKTPLQKFEELGEGYFALFEPHLWRDKIGDSKWHCYMASPDAKLFESSDATMNGAINKCYKKVKEFFKKQ